MAARIAVPAAGLLAFLALVCCSRPQHRHNTLSMEEQRAAWESQVPEPLRGKPPFRFVPDDPALPRVLIIGDSISIGYTEPVREILAGRVNVHRVPGNAGDTQRGLESLDRWLGDSRWDAITFNFGLHDLKRMRDGRLDASAERVHTPEQYAENLEAMVARLKRTSARLVWVSTTPVPAGSAGRTGGDCAIYNGVAEPIMRGHGVAVLDLHAVAAARLDEIQIPNNVHFTEEGSRVLAEAVAAAILEALKE